MKPFKLKPREKRVLVLFAIFLAIFGYTRRPWFADHVIESEHYVCHSTATTEQTQQALQRAEALYSAYQTRFADALLLATDHPLLKLKLYRDRDEFKRFNMTSGWAEAFYRKPWCHQYISMDEPDPYHWMVHEATHQLNREVAGLRLPRWLDEGIAVYFSTSRIEDGQVWLGRIDQDTYPIWWLWQLRLTGNMEQDIQQDAFIPLATIIRDRGGPSINKHFNLYYIHWWSLMHFLHHHEDGRYRKAVPELMRAKGTHRAFKQSVGPIDTVQVQWYDYLHSKQYKAHF